MARIELEQVVAEMSRVLRHEGRGAEKERTRIVAYLRQCAENSTEADTLTSYADYIEAGFHWDEPEDA